MVLVLHSLVHPLLLQILVIVVVAASATTITTATTATALANFQEPQVHLRQLLFTTLIQNPSPGSTLERTTITLKNHNLSKLFHEERKKYHPI